MTYVILHLESVSDADSVQMPEGGKAIALSSVVVLVGCVQQVHHYVLVECPQAEQEREEMRQALEPGTAPRIVAGMFAEAEKRGMSPFSAKHALAWLCEQLDAARAEVERLKECGDPLDPCRSCIKCLSGDLEIMDARRGTLSNMLRYIAFVAAGDEKADSQLAVDRLRADCDAARAEVERLRDEIGGWQSGAETWEERNEQNRQRAEQAEAALARVRAALDEIAKVAITYQPAAKRIERIIEIYKRAALEG